MDKTNLPFFLFSIYKYVFEFITLCTRLCRQNVCYMYNSFTSPLLIRQTILITQVMQLLIFQSLPLFPCYASVLCVSILLTISFSNSFKLSKTLKAFHSTHISYITYFCNILTKRTCTIKYTYYHQQSPTYFDTN